MEVVEADVVERLQLAGDVGGIGEEFERLADLHGEEVGNALALPADFERVFREPRPVADVAGHPHVSQKIHVEADRAVALAGLAPPSGHIEAEAARLPAPFLGVGQHREQVADVVPDLHVGRRITPWRAADGRLVDHDHLVELFGARDPVERAGVRHLAAEQPAKLRLQHVAHQRTLATPRDARHAHEQAERDLDVDALQVVVPHALEPQGLAGGLAPLRGHLDRVAAGEEGPRDTAVALGDVVGRARGHDLATPLTRTGAEVDDPVGRPDRVFIVLHHDDRVALVAERLKRAQELDVIAGMKTDRRLVEHVEHAREAGADLGGQPDPLTLAARERGCLAIEGQIAEADAVKKLEPARNLLHKFDGDHALGVVERKRREKLAGLGDRQGTERVE